MTTYATVYPVDSGQQQQQSEGDAMTMQPIPHERVHAILAERDRLRVALDAVVALHKRLPTDPSTCAECADFYPCHTLLTTINHLKETP